ncbi:hypothetical protein MJO28_012425 [Puccinia striiformis f. sp. tritici]|uniref:Uncharacterized protein n=1 Tax=Puccinia striiformis f. sp. tritici TaxID=168172 RepID=A0ACC0DZY8_9BASI|nr:hypothetical protein MJO28_012425 [Puccinia striiformis f. sp. tritici]KAI7945610.1 hypothetical protein MJO29_011998 [Puccinia striiformis f. sp. tritici]
MPVTPTHEGESGNLHATDTSTNKHAFPFSEFCNTGSSQHHHHTPVQQPGLILRTFPSDEGAQDPYAKP